MNKSFLKNMKPNTLCIFFNVLRTIYLDPKNVLSVWIICCLCGVLSGHWLHYDFIEIDNLCNGTVCERGKRQVVGLCHNEESHWFP